MEDPEAEPQESDFVVIKTGRLETVITEQTIQLDSLVAATHVRIVVTDAYSLGDGGRADGDGHLAAKFISFFGCEESPQPDQAADYTLVEAALAKVPAKLSAYTEETANAVSNAVNAVKEGMNITEQVYVDAMADAIENAVAALELKKVKFDNKDVLVANAKANSEQNPADNNDGPATWAFDGISGHWWHSRWQGQAVAPEVNSGLVSGENPIWIQTGFDTEWYIDSITYKARSGCQGCINAYEILVANLDDPEAEPQESDFVSIKRGNLVSVATEQTIQLAMSVR